MSVVGLLTQDNYLMYNLNLAKTVGINEAIFIGELARKWNYWNKLNRLEPDGSFYITQEDIQNDTGLSPYQQTQAIKKLIDNNLITVNKHGMPPVNYYKISESTLLSYLGNIDQVFKATLDKKLGTTNTSNTDTINTNNTTISKDIVEPSKKKTTLTEEEKVAKYEKALQNPRCKDVSAIYYWISKLPKSQEFKDAFRDWYDFYKNKGFLLNQLEQKLNDLYEVLPDENDQIERIKLCYKGPYPNFRFKTDVKKSIPTWNNNKTIIEDEDDDVSFGEGYV